MKQKYRIVPTPVLSDRRRIPSIPLLESRQQISSRVDQDDVNMLTKAQVDLELTTMRTMTPQEAAVAAAQAVAEAEVAIAEAEDAAREADAAEADAEAAQAFADAAMKALQGRSTPRMVRYLYNIRSATWFFLIASTIRPVPFSFSYPRK